FRIFRRKLMKKLFKLSLIYCLTFSSISISSTVQASGFQKSYHTNRVQTVEYHDNLVIKVVGFQNQTIAIEFPRGEKLLATHGANLINWTGVGLGDRAFLRPETNAKSGSFFIITDRHTYIFDLVPAYKGVSKSDRVSKIIFIKPKTNSNRNNHYYPNPIDVKAKGQNFNYSMEIVNNSFDIKPTEVFDDGEFTYFKFPKHAEIPAIYKGSLGTKEEWL